jgi:hypothetical protein
MNVQNSKARIFVSEIPRLSAKLEAVNRISSLEAQHYSPRVFKHKRMPYYSFSFSTKNIWTFALSAKYIEALDSHHGHHESSRSK